MGRRYTGRTVSTNPGERNSIGDYYVDEACKAIDKVAKAEAAMLIEHIPVSTQLIDSLFKPDHLVKLRQAYGLVEPSHWLTSYDLKPHVAGTLAIQFNNTGTLPPNGNLVSPNDAAKPFFATCQEIRDIHIKWGAVKHMLRWFNRNATPAAIRAYWPAVMNLCKDAPNVKAMGEKTPERYDMPPGLNNMLALVRETAGTVATMQLIDDRKGRENNGLFLTIPEGDVMVAGSVIKLNNLSYNL